MGITIKDVARLAGVDASTVSRVLNNKNMVKSSTAQRVMAAAAELGYSINPLASGLKGGSSYTIGVITPLFTNPHNMRLIEGIEGVTEKEGYTLLVSRTNNDLKREKQIVECFNTRRVDAVIVSTSDITGKYLLDYVADGMPVVLLERYVRGLNIDMVYEDVYTVSTELTNYLIHKGHKKIAYYYGRTEMPSNMYRMEGHINSMKAAGIPIDERFLIDVEIDRQAAYDSTIKLLSMEDKPTAILSYNSYLTEGIIDAIRSMNLKIPMDISVVSCNQMIGHRLIEPEITCMAPQYFDLGRAAANLALKRIAQKKEGLFPADYIGEQVVIQPSFVRGASVKKI